MQGERRGQSRLDYAEPPPKVHLYEKIKSKTILKSWRRHSKNGAAIKKRRSEKNARATNILAYGSKCQGRRTNYLGLRLKNPPCNSRRKGRGAREENLAPVYSRRRVDTKNPAHLNSLNAKRYKLSDGCAGFFRVKNAYIERGLLSDGLFLSMPFSAHAISAAGARGGRRFARFGRLGFLCGG